MRVLQQPAYVLLNRPYSETSWIVEVFSRDYGRLSLMAKGARRLKSKVRGALIPFQPLLVSWVGKGEIPTLTEAELDRSEFSFLNNEIRGDALVCGFYCNELLVKMLHRYDSHAALFKSYHKAIMSLSSADKMPKTSVVLRSFEQSIIRESGYAIDFEKQADNQQAIQAQRQYQFFAGRGFIAQISPNTKAISGRVILALSDKPPSDLSSIERSQARDLMRLILKNTMNKGDIVSRSLFYPRNSAQAITHNV